MARYHTGGTVATCTRLLLLAGLSTIWAYWPSTNSGNLGFVESRLVAWRAVLGVSFISFLPKESRRFYQIWTLQKKSYTQRLFWLASIKDHVEKKTWTKIYQIAGLLDLDASSWLTITAICVTGTAKCRR